jgi:hypothetical protein
LSDKAIAVQAAAVRGAFVHHRIFTPAWCADRIGVWCPRGWAVGNAWGATPWDTLGSTFGLVTPTYYYYGSGVILQNDMVYLDGARWGAAEDWAAQASRFADAGRWAPPSDDTSWQPLGVFALVQGDEKTSNNVFQLAINKDGVIRGNYYNVLTDSSVPIYGTLDRKTQRVAWKIGNVKSTVYEAGLANLTKDESPVLVHFGTEQTHQWMLIRVKQPEGKEKEKKEE